MERIRVELDKEKKNCLKIKQEDENIINKI